MIEETTVVAPSKKEIIAKQLLEIDELKNKLASTESSLKYAQEARSNAEAELTDVHEFLDGFDWVLSHEKKNGYSKNKLSTRLMSYFVKSKE